ncbi:hypothetical protein TRIP_B250420 [uncultured Desulfatiglans sp.]|nr:hypothetical protein TRIP_B250420 [uncultured Desulfatiglans sp.]
MSIRSSIDYFEAVHKQGLEETGEHVSGGTGARAGLAGSGRPGARTPGGGPRARLRSDRSSP